MVEYKKMANFSMLTVGDSAVDNTFEIDSDQASLLCGSRLQDKELCFKYGEKIPIKKIRRGFGGSALNTAIGFSRLGIKTAITTIIGEDNEGKDVLDFLQQEAVDTSRVQQDNMTNMSVILVYSKERTILSYHSPRDYTKLEMPRADNIYLASAGRGSESLIPKIQARISSGSKLYFNPGSWELLKFENFAPLVKYCQALILNKEEADLCFKEGPVAKQLQDMKRLGTDIAVITDGPKGAYISQGKKVYHMGISSGQVVDPTGAGDSFSVGLVGGLSLNKSLEESCRWGMVNSASVLEYIGANKGLLSLRQIEQEAEQAINLKLKLIEEE